MLEHQIHVLKFLQAYGESLVADIQPEDFCKQPVAGMNHPAWIIGHLAFANSNRLPMIGGERRLGDWEQQFGRGSEVTPNTADYPSKDELLAAWRDANDRLIAAASKVDAAVLEQTPDVERIAKAFTTIGNFITFLMTAHTGMHLGQLSAWRRASGLPPV